MSLRDSWEQGQPTYHQDYRESKSSLWAFVEGMAQGLYLCCVLAVGNAGAVVIHVPATENSPRPEIVDTSRPRRKKGGPACGPQLRACHL